MSDHPMTQNTNALRGALGKPPHAIDVRGAARLRPMWLLHCVLMMLGGVSIGYLISGAFLRRATVMHWGTALGLTLSYVAVFANDADCMEATR